MPIIDLLEQLFELKWRDTAIPCADFRTRIIHDQVHHEWPDQDGAHIEATGRKALLHTATIPFYSNIRPGLSETWNVGGQVLYPTVFRAFHIAMTTRTTGPLQHPEFGVINCKPVDATEHWSSTRRDGCIVEASWVESLDDNVTEFQDILASKSPVPAAQVAAVDLDAQLADYNGGEFADPTQPSFTSAVRAITSAFNAATLVQSQYTGQVNAVMYRLNAIQVAVQGLGDPNAWPLANSALRLQDALSTIQEQLLAGQRQVLVYKVGLDQPLTMLVGTLQTSVTDLLTLNPQLASKPYVSSGTRVRYYSLGV
jgi:hypothetical protein